MPNRLVGQLIEDQTPLIGAPALSVREAARQMSAKHCGSILVCDQQRLVGIFTERDLLDRVVAAGRDLDGTSLGEVMTRDPDTIDVDDRVHNAIRRMHEFGYRHLPVMDGKQVAGVVSLRDMPLVEVSAMQSELDERDSLAERLR